MAKTTAIYKRVSTDQQTTKSQEADLASWAQNNDVPVRVYEDAASGKTMDRPGWHRLENDIMAGRIDRVVCWRLDRLGRTASGLTKLFDTLQERGVGLVSLREGIDLSTPAGRLMANVIASVAQYETELRGERVRAGQLAAKLAGKKWGGSKPGRRKATATQVRAIHRLRQENTPIARIARAVNLSVPTVYRILSEIDWSNTLWHVHDDRAK